MNRAVPVTVRLDRSEVLFIKWLCRKHMEQYVPSLRDRKAYARWERASDLYRHINDVLWYQENDEYQLQPEEDPRIPSRRDDDDG